MSQVLQLSKTCFFAGLVVGLSVFAACKKEENEERILSTRDKLLGNWRRNLRAYDYNGNGKIDSSDVYHSAVDTLFLSLAPDNSYSRIEMYKGVGTPVTGTWHLQRNDSEIVFQPSTSSSHIDTMKFDTVSQEYFMLHTNYPGVIHYYEGYIRK
jgi:hypothetical protein